MNAVNEAAWMPFWTTFSKGRPGGHTRPSATFLMPVPGGMSY